MCSMELGIATRDGVESLQGIFGLRLTGGRCWESQGSDSVFPCVRLSSDHSLPGNPLWSVPYHLVDCSHIVLSTAVIAHLSVYLTSVTPEFCHFTSETPGCSSASWTRWVLRKCLLNKYPPSRAVWRSDEIMDGKTNHKLTVHLFLFSMNIFMNFIQNDMPYVLIVLIIVTCAKA